ncbi:hypothetical protein EVAR_88840_1 [Eumeta japonica]|uniref:Uncharacterized protein n=1 Tax=Eumeta variegata TaxID=151549 RepID=A0A4C1Y456_EUMVA|nr:hypothetical protein EVAR_88840_1 [Eumeta japonica]
MSDMRLRRHQLMLQNAVPKADERKERERKWRTVTGAEAESGTRAETGCKTGSRVKSDSAIKNEKNVGTRIESGNCVQGAAGAAVRPAPGDVLSGGRGRPSIIGGPPAYRRRPPARYITL